MKNININKVRAIYYGLFSSLFSYIENEEEYKNIVKTLEFLSLTPIDEYSNEAFININNYLKEEGFSILKEENNDLFFSPSTTFIPVTASFYTEDRDDGQKRVEMTNLVLKSKFRKDSKSFKEAEDHICFIFAFLQKLIQEDFSVENRLAYEVFSSILNEMIDEFINNIYSHENSQFYKNIAILLKVFIELERSFYNIKDSKNSKNRKQPELFHQKKKEFKQRAKRNFDEVTTL
ncbi:hypothetical protein CRU99_12950 [Malaciobacter mytili]|uniref:TorD/DmsD family molecular chaperone n=1 Tax=Malaciobacter mytili TaxID=603050 RepID=UPI00100ABCA5|nr:molecular chaperone TorD family protein [Malaciobacter mytili]RXI36976.1 hypothetical protein CRU99_12950 [Malaciobacter mytili]